MNEATITCGEDPDYAKRDLYETIEKGGNVKWTMKVQTMTPEEATQVDFDPFDISTFESSVSPEKGETGY